VMAISYYSSTCIIIHLSYVKKLRKTFDVLEVPGHFWKEVLEIDIIDLTKDVTHGLWYHHFEQFAVIEHCSLTFATLLRLQLLMFTTEPTPPSSSSSSLPQRKHKRSSHLALITPSRLCRSCKSFRTVE
jgi:hypothetical protein